MKIFTFLLIIFWFPLTYGQNQFIDTSFGTHGGYSMYSSNPEDFAFRSLIEHNNAIYAIHMGVGGQLYLSNYNLNGLLNTNFGTNGYVALNGMESILWLGNTYNHINVTSDNKLLIALGRMGTLEETQIPLLTKFNLDGTRDLSYGTNGQVEHHVTTNNVSILDSYKYPQDEMLLLCYKLPTSTNYQSELFLVKIDAAGNYDVTFGVNGKLTLPSDYTGYIPQSATIKDNSVYVQFYSQVNPSYIKKYDFLTSSYDVNFGNNGLLTIVSDLPYNSSHFTIDDNNDIYVAASNPQATNHLFVVKYSNQVIDQSFGNNGFFELPMGNLHTQVYNIRRNGEKLYVLGEMNNTTDYGTSFIAALNLNGTADTTFGENSAIVNYLFADMQLLFDYIHLDDFIIAGGLCPSGNFNYAPCLVKYIANNSLGTATNSATNFSYFPNPTTGDLYFKSNEEVLAISVFDMIGRQVKSEAVVGNKTNLSNLSRGTYIVKVKTQSKPETFKIILN